MAPLTKQTRGVHNGSSQQNLSARLTAVVPKKFEPKLKSNNKKNILEFQKTTSEDGSSSIKVAKNLDSSKDLAVNGVEPKFEIGKGQDQIDSVLDTPSERQPQRPNPDSVTNDSLGEFFFSRSYYLATLSKFVKYQNLILYFAAEDARPTEEAQTFSELSTEPSTSS